MDNESEKLLNEGEEKTTVSTVVSPIQEIQKSDKSDISDLPKGAPGKTIAQPINTVYKTTDKSPENSSERSDIKDIKEDSNTGESSRYQVNVKHYAHYDKSENEVYSQEMQQSLKYAARTPFGRFVLDFCSILLTPGAFWKAQELHPATIGQVHWPHLVILILLRTLAVFIGKIFLPHAGIGTVILQSLTQGIMIFALVWGFALVVSGVSALSGAGISVDKGLRFSAYSITPVVFVGIIAVIPVPYLATICDLLAMPWAFVVLGAGILPYLNIKPEKAPVITGLLCGILVILWSVMPMLIPYLIGLASGY